MRFALKVFYDGRNFHGSQVQPGKRTVEGELLKALAACGAGVEGFQGAGRTDRGVSALGNVYAVSTDVSLSARALNSNLPSDVRVLAVKAVHDYFKPRKEAVERVYKYFLRVEGLDVEAMRRAAQLFEGEKSFHSFCKTSSRSTTRRLRRVVLKEKECFLVIIYVGDSFLWQMVRRITTALTMVGSGELSVEELQRYFEPSHKGKLPPATPENLVLWNVRYAFDFEPEKYSLQRFRKELEARVKGLKSSLLIGEEMHRGLGEDDID